MTVNLAAVAAARSELRAIVARYPELSTPAAHARLAGSLPEVLSMSRPIDPSRQSVQVGVRLTPDMATAVDREVSRLQRAAVAAGLSLTIGRAEALRSIILRWMDNQAPAIPSSTPAPSPPARATLALVEPSPAPPVAPLVSPSEACDQCGVTIARIGCASPECSAVVSVCGCEASLARDGYCDQHAPKPAPQASPPAAPLVLSPSPAAVDEDSLRAKLRRLQASEEGTSVKGRKWSNVRVAAAAGLGSETTVRRWLSGKNIEAPALARLAAYLRAQPEV